MHKQILKEWVPLFAMRKRSHRNLANKLQGLFMPKISKTKVTGYVSYGPKMLAQISSYWSWMYRVNVHYWAKPKGKNQ